VPQAICESEFDSTTTLCGPVPEALTVVVFDAVAEQGPVLVLPPVDVTVAPPVPDRPPVVEGLPLMLLPPAAVPPIPVWPPARLLAPPVVAVPPVLFVLLPPRPPSPPVAWAPPADWPPIDAVVATLLVVPPEGACVAPPLGTVPPVLPPEGACVAPPLAKVPPVLPVPPETAPPEATTVLVEPSLADGPESELPHPARFKLSAISVKAVRGWFFILDLLELRAAVAALREYRFIKRIGPGRVTLDAAKQILQASRLPLLFTVGPFAQYALCGLGELVLKRYLRHRVTASPR